VRSHLLVGRVAHRRLRGPAYALEHRVWQLALDLDELDDVDESLRLLSRNRRNVLEVRDADHLIEPATDLARDVRAVLAKVGLDASSWSILMVTNPRVLGYVFNPATFYLCRDEDRLEAVLVEVHNTHGERHLSPLVRSPGDPPGRLSAGIAKSFYVSPFLDLDASYRVHVRDDHDRLVISIEERESGERMLATSLVLERRRLTDRALLGLLVRRPFITQRTTAWIHWHALRLWLRGARFRRHRSAGPARGSVLAGPTTPPGFHR
jgi:hypothetical protein